MASTVKQDHFQFGLSRIFGVMVAVASWLALFSYDRIAVPLFLPTVLVTAYLLGARPARLKTLAVLVALGGAVAGFVVAVKTYPVIVIADSLAAGAYAENISRDAAVFGSLLLGVAILGGPVTRYRWAFWACALSLGLLTVTVGFASDDTPESARWAIVFVFGFFVALRVTAAPSPACAHWRPASSPAFGIIVFTYAA